MIKSENFEKKDENFVIFFKVCLDVILGAKQVDRNIEKLNQNNFVSFCLEKINNCCKHLIFNKLL